MRITAVFRVVLVDLLGPQPGTDSEDPTERLARKATVDGTALLGSGRIVAAHGMLFVVCAVD